MRTVCAPSWSARFGDRVRLLDTLGAVSVDRAGINASFQNLRRGTDALAAAGIVAGARRDVVVQDHLDDRPRAARRCGQAAARDVHRITVRLKAGHYVLRNP